MATPHRARHPSGRARRKNHLFAGSDGGGDRWGRCRFSLRHGPIQQRRALRGIRRNPPNGTEKRLRAGETRAGRSNSVPDAMAEAFR